MNAAYFETTGDPSVILYGEQPDPTAGPGQILVRVEAASVNPIDTYIRAGTIPMTPQLPAIPGCDFAGVVEEVGPGVSRFQPGDRVWGSNQSLFGRQGTFAEKLAVDEEWAYPIPQGQSSESAAAGALTGITAHLGLFLHSGLREGEFVFVNGGSGGVGSAVIQFAKAAGATVLTTAGTEQKRALCRELGADHVFDYKSESLDDDIRAVCEAHGGLDIWWETQREPTLERSIALMRKRGRIVLMAGRDAQPQFPLGAFYVNDLRMIGFAMFNASPQEQRDAADAMNGWFTSGQWKPLIGKQFPLKDAAQAHALQEENTLRMSGTLSGKIVVTCSTAS